MNTKPKVTVIIPTYQRPNILGRAIESVLGQTFQDFEIIVIDDASKDHTEEVVGRFLKKRVKFYQHESQKGGGAARNTGLRHAIGEYIAFLDDDDEWYPEKLEMQVQLLEKSSTEIGGIYTGHHKIDSVSGEILKVGKPQKRGNLYPEIFKANWLGTTSSLLLKRECFEKVGEFDESLQSFQDYDMWIRMAKFFHFDFILQPLVKYYVHDVKIWNNLDALEKGLARMLEKNGKESIFKRQMSLEYLTLGVRYFHNKDYAKGKRAFIQAITLNPFQIDSYLNLGLGMVGENRFVQRRERLKKFLPSRVC